MKKIGILIFAAALVIGLVVSNMFSFGRSAGRWFNFTMNCGSVRGSGNLVNDSRDLSGFNAVDVGGVFQVEISAQKDFSVEVAADDNILPLISTSVEDGVLRIESEGKISPTKPIVIRISAPDIEKLDVSGVANVNLRGLKNSELAIDASGASKVKIAGETGKLTIDVSGATRIDADDLLAVDATIGASGASKVGVNVTGELRTEASGASSIVYSGTPQNVVRSTHGGSRVTQK